MKKLVWLMASAAWVLAGASAQAQEQPAESAAPSAERESQQGVLVYEPAFFASANPSTALDMITRVPGFRINDGDNVRGFAGASGNILINGARPASKSDTGSGVLGRTPAARVERVELVRGGAPGIDMDGHPVVVNVILSRDASRRQTMLANTVLFEGGPNLYSGRYEFAASENGTEWGFQLGRGMSMNDSTGPGVLTRRNSGGAVILEEDLRSEFDGGGWNGRANWSGPVGRGQVELTGSGSDSFYEDRLVMTSGAGTRRFDFRVDTLRGDLGLRYQRPLTETLRLEGRLIQNLASTDLLNAARTTASEQIFNSERATGETIARAVLRWERSDRMTVEGGGEAAYNFLDTSQTFFVDGTQIALPLANTRVEEMRGEIFAQTTLRRSETLSLEAGVRLEHSTITQTGDSTAERSFFYPKPRLAMTWTPRENHQLRLRFERVLGQLNFQDFAASTQLNNDQVLGGNLDLRPEQRWISELVFERRFLDEGVFTLTLRHDEIVDVIEMIPLPGGLTAVGNVGDGTLDRVGVNLRLPADRLGIAGGRFTFNAQYDHTRIADPTTGEDRQISRVRPLTGSVRFDQDLPDYDLTWGAEYIPFFRETSFTPDQQRLFELRNYVILFAEYTIREGVSLRAQVNVWDDFRIDREVYADRTTRDIAFTETQRIDPRDFLQLRLRASF